METSCSCTCPKNKCALDAKEAAEFMLEFGRAVYCYCLTIYKSEEKIPDNLVILLNHIRSTVSDIANEKFAKICRMDVLRKFEPVVAKYDDRFVYIIQKMAKNGTGCHCVKNGRECNMELDNMSEYIDVLIMLNSYIIKGNKWYYNTNYKLADKRALLILSRAEVDKYNICRRYLVDLFGLRNKGKIGRYKHIVKKVEKYGIDDYIRRHLIVHFSLVQFRRVTRHVMSLDVMKGEF